jgi:hypothetical protein
MIPLLLGLGLVVGASGWATYAEVGGEWVEGLHEGSAMVMLGAVVAHVLGVVAVSLLQRENLVLPFLTGRKEGAPGARIRSSRPLVALLLVAALGALWIPGLSARERRSAAHGTHAVATAEDGATRASDTD